MYQFKIIDIVMYILAFVHSIEQNRSVVNYSTCVIVCEFVVMCVCDTYAHRYLEFYWFSGSVGMVCVWVG